MFCLHICKYTARVPDVQGGQNRGPGYPAMASNMWWRAGNLSQFLCKSSDVLNSWALSLAPRSVTLKALTESQAFQ